MVVVTKENFIEKSNDFLDHLPSAAFVALDEEMTGIQLPSSSGRIPKDETPDQRYPELKKSPETYSIIQLGICLFHYTADAQPPPSDEDTFADWTVRRYNFFVFPGQDSDRSVVLNPSAVAFLHQHNISFDKWTKEGIPFQTESQAKETLKTYLEKQLALEAKKFQEKKQPTIQDASKRKVQLRRTEDIDFFSRSMANLRTWLDSPVSPDQQPNGGESEGASYLLPECNSFLRRALYESIEQEYPSLVLEKVQGAQRIRVLRMSDEEKERRDQRLRNEAWEKLIVEQVGLYRIFHALSQAARGFQLQRDSPLLAPHLDKIDWHAEPSLYRGPRNRKIPLVLHNGFMDLCFLLTHFVSPKLPDELSDCKALIRKYFPAVYDTKILALECSSAFRNDNSRLGALFERVHTGQLERRIKLWKPKTATMTNEEHEAQHNGTGVPAPPVVSEEHFADYDAYMTGVCYLGICESILRMSDNGSGVAANPEVGALEHLLWPIDHPNLRKTFGRNLLYQMSMFTLDLEDSERDPLCRGMEKESTFRVSSINASTTTRDIVTCVSGLYDQEGRPVSFEIIWVDDTTFMVAASARHQAGLQDGQDSLLLCHGALIRDALKRRFSDCTVVSLGKHLENLEREKQLALQKAAAVNRPPLVKRLLSYIGIGHPEPVEQPAAKKRKLN